MTQIETDRPFRQFDVVKWESTANGKLKEKVGVIVVVVPAGLHPKDYVPGGYRVDTCSGGRDHESYLVEVKKRPLLYWPRVKDLEYVRRWEGVQAIPDGDRP